MYQQITIVGNLGKDPEMRYTPAGKPVTNFSVAVNRTYNGEKETTWFRVTAWDKQAEACNTYLTKGSKVLVVGRLSSDPKTGGPRLWTGQNGQANANFEIQASVVQFLSSKGENSNGGGNHDHNEEPEGEMEAPW